MAQAAGATGMPRPSLASMPNTPGAVVTATAAHEIPSTRASRARWWGGLVVFSAVSLGLCRLGLALTAAPGTVALFWPVAASSPGRSS